MTRTRRSQNERTSSTPAAHGKERTPLSADKEQPHRPNIHHKRNLNIPVIIPVALNSALTNILTNNDDQQ